MLRRSSSLPLWAFVLVACAGAVDARAEDEMVWNGSLALRTQATVPSWAETLSSTADQPLLHGLVEANAQTRAKWFDKRLSLVSDVSLFAQRGFFFVDDGDAVLDHDIAEHHPRLVISELSLRLELFETVDVTVGKQRVVWGTGIANNPTDVINPPRDPTDPAFQRAGTWQLKVDVPLENLTWSAFFAPTILHSEVGVPVAAFAWPDFAFRSAAKRDNELHWSAGARLYVLVADTDLNLWVVWSNLDAPNDATGTASTFADKTRLMASASRLLGDQIEVHGELRLQTGSSRVYVDEDCVVDDAALVGCAFGGTAPIARTDLESDELVPHALLGFRWLPPDESVFTVEYLYAGDGYDNDELAAFFALQALVRDRTRAGLPVPTLGPASTDGLPARNPVDVLRQHTLFLSYTRPRIFDDFTVGVGAVVAVEDLSSLVNVSLTWSAREWLQLQAFAFVPTPSLPRLAGGDVAIFANPFSAPLVNDSTGDRIVGAYDVVPFSARAVVEARVFF